MNLNLKGLRAVALVAVIGITSALAQQAVTPSQQGGMMQKKMAAKGSQSAKMKAMREKMMADMKANQATMDMKVAAMNAANGTAKTDAMAAVINEMVAQQKQMMANMDTICKQMMANMAHPDAPMKGMDMGNPHTVVPQ
ncbi:MAG: hypothetical protein M3Y72_14520 [Acidobacteriota bacterium]|nr:hypothetical protein [Acidobacteriota bacterium]